MLGFQTVGVVPMFFEGNVGFVGWEEVRDYHLEEFGRKGSKTVHCGQCEINHPDAIRHRE